jgi:hypothetical protein
VRNGRTEVCEKHLVAGGHAGLQLARRLPVALRADVAQQLRGAVGQLAPLQAPMSQPLSAHWRCQPGMHART